MKETNVLIYFTADYVKQIRYFNVVLLLLPHREYVVDCCMHQCRLCIRRWQVRPGEVLASIQMDLISKYICEENKHQQHQRFISVHISIIYQIIRMTFSLTCATRQQYWLMLEAANLLIKYCINVVVNFL